MVSLLHLGVSLCQSDTEVVLCPLCCSTELSDKLLWTCFFCFRLRNWLNKSEATLYLCLDPKEKP